MPPLLAARISFALAAALAVVMAAQWLRRGKRPHHAAWALGFCFYAAGTFIEAFCRWTPATVRVYFFVAAYMTAATLGQGTAYLLLRRRIAHLLAWALAIGGAVALAACLLAPLDPHVPMPPRGEVSMRMLPEGLRTGTMVFNVYGVALLAGGAFISARNRRLAPRRRLANVLILVGVLGIGAAGAATKAGNKEILLYAELAGLCLLAAGVLLAG